MHEKQSAIWANKEKFMSKNLILTTILIASATFAQAQEARVTDEQDIKYILGSHPETQRGPVAASLAAGKLNKVTAIRVKQTKSQENNGCDLFFLIESELTGSVLTETNSLCIPEAVFKKN